MLLAIAMTVAIGADAVLAPPAMAEVVEVEEEVPAATTR